MPRYKETKKEYAARVKRAALEFPKMSVVEAAEKHGVSHTAVHIMLRLTQAELDAAECVPFPKRRKRQPDTRPRRVLLKTLTKIPLARADVVPALKAAVEWHAYQLSHALAERNRGKCKKAERLAAFLRRK